MGLVSDVFWDLLGDYQIYISHGIYVIPNESNKNRVVKIIALGGIMFMGEEFTIKILAWFVPIFALCTLIRAIVKEDRKRKETRFLIISLCVFIIISIWFAYSICFRWLV